MRVLVCGGRGFGYVPGDIAKWTPAYNSAVKRANAERRLLDWQLSTLEGIEIVIHGFAPGADALAAQWARRNHVAETGSLYRANWYPNGRHGGLDKSAGPRRNARMIEEGKPDLVVAFPGGRGTEDMVRRAEAAGVKAIRVEAGARP